MQLHRRALIGTIAALAPLALAHAQSSYYWSLAEECYYNQTGHADSFLSPCWNGSGPTAAPTPGYGPPTAGSDVYLVGAAEFLNFQVSSIGAPASLSNLVIDDIFPSSYQVQLGLDWVTPITVTGTEMVGQNGTGNIAMTAGTNVAPSIIVGANAGSDGDIQVLGGSLSAGTLTVGSSGYGTVSQDQSYASSSVSVTGSLILGSGAGIFGNYYLSDGILNVGQEVVAQSGNGYVYQSGGTHTIGSLQLAQNAGSQGQFTFVGGTLTVNGDVVGGAGTSLLEIDAPGASFNGNVSGISSLSVGSNPGSNGVFATGGAQSVSAQVELIGDEGTGTWTQSGGTNTASTLALGEIAGSTGVYFLVGGTLSADYLQVGVSGAGTFTQYSGTSVRVTSELDAGQFSGSSGTYNQYGGSLSAPLELIGQSAPMAAPAVFVQSGGTNSTDSMQLGDLGAYELLGGQLNVTNNLIGNGELEIGGGSLSVGGIVSIGTLLVDVYSSYTASTELDLSSSVVPSAIAGALTVDPVGSLNIYGSASVSGMGSLTNNGTLSIGSSFSSAPAQLVVNDYAQLQNNGYLQLIGAGAILVHGGTFTNGANGNLVMTIPSSSQVSVDGDGAFINQGAVSQFSGDVSLTVTDPSLTPTITNQGNWTLYAPATLTVQSGQFTNVSGATLNNASGTVTVGAGGMLVNAGQLNSGGTVTVGSGGSLVNPGQFVNSGTVHVLAAGQVVSDGGFTNSAMVTIDSGASFSGAGTYIQTSGLTKVYGTLSMPAIYNQGGSFGGSGTVNGSALDPSAPPVEFYNDGGTIAPGDPALLTINGNLHFSSGLLDIKIAGLNSLDQLAVTGLAEFTGGAIELDFIDGFAPSRGDSFYFLLANNLGSFDITDFRYTGLQPGFQFDIAADANGLDMTALNDGVSSVSAVPLPAGAWLLAAGLALFAVGGRALRLTLPAPAGTAPRSAGTARCAEWISTAHGSAGSS